MNPVFDVISTLMSQYQNPKWEGWATEDKAHALMMAAFTIRPTVAVEIGVYAGRSCIPVALVMKECGHGVIHAIDPWNPAASAEGYDEQNSAWWTNVANHEYAFDQFQKITVLTGTQNHVDVHRIKSDDFEPPAVIDLLHVDGQHTPQAIRDVERYASKVRVGGIVCMDDLHWHNEGSHDVLTAVDKLKELGFVQLYLMFDRARGLDCGFFQRV